jgi:hypothetical protein
MRWPALLARVLRQMPYKKLMRATKEFNLSALK